LSGARSAASAQITPPGAAAVGVATDRTPAPGTRRPDPVSLECRDLLVRLTGSNGAVDILKGVDLSVRRGEFVSVLGASGSGKTTLLRVLGGLAPVTGGEVRCDGSVVSGPPPGVVTVFQDYSNSLLPWRTVRRNVALGVEGRLGKTECEQRIDEALAMVNLTASAAEYPYRLSGGMQQRVQIARALAMRPSVLLMDEPFGALDAMTKASLQDQLQQVQAATGTTVVFVTHDVEEAVYLSDRVVVLSGRPAAVGLSLDVPLPRPRNQITTKESPDYLDLRHRVYAALGHGSPR
jgi:NitT/TauT family transport system ATP-binding protein